jgi:hypothetical protein
MASAGVSEASRGGGGSLGDDNPYPLACFDFSGVWKSDSGEFLAIEQGQCEWLKIKATYDSQDVITTIVPDDKARKISGNRWVGEVRHRWNNKTYATMIETHRKMKYADRVVTDLVLLEKVNDNLILESTYRTTEMNPGEEQCTTEPRYTQRVFRLQPGAGRSGGYR